MGETCPTCDGDCFVDAVAEGDIIHPHATGPNDEPLVTCPTCDGDGEVDDPSRKDTPPAREAQR